MKIALIAGQFPAVSETFVLDQITGLLDRGAEVDIYALGRRPQPAVHPAVERYQLLRRTTYASAPPQAGAGEIRRKLRSLRVLGRALIHAAPSPTHLRSVLRHGREDVRRALRFVDPIAGVRRRYDVIHCHFGPSGQWGEALRNLGLLSGRLATTFHGYDMTRFIRDEGPEVYRRLFAAGDLFLPISEFWRDRLVELGCDPARIQVHHMGVDCASFVFCRRALPADGSLRLLSVGRLVEKKGLEYGIRAVAGLAQRFPRIEYTILGDGPLGPRLSGLIQDLGLEQHVRMPGSKPRHEVLSAMQRAHLLLAPSVTASDGDQEGIPVVLMEAMATGLPVLSTRHTGIPEIVQDGVTGYLVGERDVDGLADAVSNLAADPSSYERISAAGRRRVEQEFDINRLNDRLLETFHRISR